MATGRTWGTLADSTKRRYRAAGVTPQQYNGIQRRGARGELKAARGHKTTPERPSRATSKPHLYQPYLRKRAATNPEFAQYVEPDRKDSLIQPETISPSDIRQAGDAIAYAYVNPKTNQMIVQRYSFDGDTTTVELYSFNDGEFPEIMKRLRGLQYIATVDSDPEGWAKRWDRASRGEDI